MPTGDTVRKHQQGTTRSKADQVNVNIDGPDLKRRAKQRFVKINNK